ncbi:S-methyl-5-thioribose-1-phosphate isomerase [Thermoleophilum album]|uniref:Methylthioribose-1-phosphate isomerase n=1 Tax=Thermoleophilum album TaxID=29539 RepID=A0A1H6FJQ5_THEAL|nr:S-methyl-5-thioribose-1-phosphate isomerase [Thermoleophilum album]SEH10398.1 methylthioribose-1-phosphate isomerase [Thermoleophilum album]
MSADDALAPTETSLARPIERSQDGTLRLLDQRALPHQERWIEVRTAEEAVAAIRALAVRGAPAIGIAAAYTIALIAEREGVEQARSAAHALASARPTAVNLGWACRRMLARLEACAGDGQDVASALASEADAIAHEQHAADRAIATAGAELVPPGGRLLTICNTGALATGAEGTALAVALEAHRRGRLAEVLVLETRPLLQGARLTTWELARAGVPHRLLCDSAAATACARGLVDCVFVGADRIARNGDVANKIGTYMLAVLARHHGIPFYVAAPLSTFDPATPDGRSIPIEERAPAEVSEFAGQAIAPARTKVWNPAFDITPAALVSAIVCERGVLRPPLATAIARVAGSAERSRRAGGAA